MEVIDIVILVGVILFYGVSVCIGVVKSIALLINNGVSALGIFVIFVFLSFVPIVNWYLWDE